MVTDCFILVLDQRNKGLSTKFARADLQDVRERLAMLKRKRDAGRSAEGIGDIYIYLACFYIYFSIDVERAILAAREVQRRDEEARRERRRDARKRRRQRDTAPAGEDAADGGEDQERTAMAALMGFAGFGSTAK